MFIGYRTESFSGSGIRDLEEVIGFEMQELRNNDIPLYLLENYKLLSKYEWMFNNEISIYDEESRVGVDEYIHDLINEIIVNIEEILKSDKLHAIWLGEEDDIRRNYADSFSIIDKYTIKGEEMIDYMIISDLEEDGKLIVYKA